MQTTRLLCFCLAVLFLAGCRKSETSAPAEATVSRPQSVLVTEAQRKGNRMEVPESGTTELKGRGGREITRASLNKEQNRLLDHHLQKRMQKGDAEVSTQPLADLVAGYQAARTTGEKVDALNGLAGRDDPAAFKLLMQAAVEGETPEQIAALEVLAEAPRAEHLPTVQTALQSSDMDVRLTGLALLSQVHSEAALPLWEAVLNHTSGEVSQFGFEQLPNLPPHLQVPIVKQALARNEAWMTEQSLHLLGGITSKPAVEALIPFLEHPTSGDLAQSGLFFLLSEPFDTVEQATEWWQLNSARLGPDLQPIDLN